MYRKVLITLFILHTFLFSFRLFPENAQEFKAYAMGSGGIFLWYEFAEIVTDKWYFKYPIAIAGGGFTSMCLAHHLQGYETWHSTGRGHGLVLRVGIDIIKIFTKKKDKVAYAGTIDR